MVDVFVSAGCNQNGDKLKFVCSQVCADMEEVIDGLPFGEIQKVCTGLTWFEGWICSFEQGSPC